MAAKMSLFSTKILFSSVPFSDLNMSNAVVLLGGVLKGKINSLIIYCGIVLLYGGGGYCNPNCYKNNYYSGKAQAPINQERQQQKLTFIQNTFY